MSGSAVFVFADLDDSLFQSRRKCPPNSLLSTAAVDRQGQPLSFFTPEQQALLRILQQQGTLIPATGRNSVALDRVRIPFTHYRITSHGAMILAPDGHPEPSWLAAICERQAHWAERMTAVLPQIEEAGAGLDIRYRVIEDQGVPVYVSIKGEEGALLGLLPLLHNCWSDHETLIHHNGENLALLPPYARKDHAVAFVMERLREQYSHPLFIGLGDSQTDLPFLRLCHYAMVPRAGQIRL